MLNIFLWPFEFIGWLVTLIIKLVGGAIGLAGGVVGGVLGLVGGLIGLVIGLGVIFAMVVGTVFLGRLIVSLVRGLR